MNEKFRKIRSITKNKSKLLKSFNYKSIQAVRKEYGSNYSNNQLYEKLKELYNDKIDENNKIKNKNKRVLKSTLKEQLNNYNIESNITRRSDRGDLKPFRVVINNEVKYYVVGDIKQKPETMFETINTDKNGNNLIIKASRKEDVKVDEIVNEKYMSVWDGYGDIYKTPQFEEYIGRRYVVGGISSHIIYFLINTDFQASLPPKKKNINIMNQPMHLSKPYKGCFLKYFENFDNCSYVDNEGECVLKTLVDVLNRNNKIYSYKFLEEKFNEASLTLYGYRYKKKNGITTNMLLNVCQKLNISLLGYDENNNQFVRNTPDRNRRKDGKAIVFQMALKHFYIITDSHIINSLTQLNNTYCKDLKVEEEKQLEYDYVIDDLYNSVGIGFSDKEKQKTDYLTLPNNTVFITEEPLLNIVMSCIEKNIIPIIKYETLTTIKTVILKIKDENKTIRVVNPSIKEMTLNELIAICDRADIPFKNQNIGGLLNDIQMKFYKPKRVPVPEELKQKVLEEQNNKCQSCFEYLTDKYELDHIKPVCSGGSNDRENLQILCVPCHKEKSDNEYSEYINHKQYTSCLNIEAYRIMMSLYSRKVAFSHYYDENKEQLDDIEYHFKEDYLNGIQSIDINGCRRNLIKYSKYNYPVYSVLDNWEDFDGNIEDGNYYVETDDYSLFHKIGIYSKPIVEIGLNEGIITKDNIKKQFKSSKSLSNEYFIDFINFVWDKFGGTTHQKLAINSFIGLLGRRDSHYIQNDYSLKDDNNKIGKLYEKYGNPYINDYGNIISITNKIKIEKLETDFYIHSQILDLEAIELYKLCKSIKNVGGIPICCKTDCVIFYHRDKQPLKIDDIYFSDDVKKYKYEDKPMLLQNQNKCYCENPLIFNDSHYECYDKNEIYTDDTYDNIINKIIESNKGCLILGSAGTGKSYLINKLSKQLEENDKKVLRLAPTNKSARIINGETLDKYCYKVLRSKKGLENFKKIDYIFIDEVSMVRETFYKVMIMLKHANPNTKFIISGDFHQLEPVNDNIKNRSYENSRVLYELVDGMKITLTKCMRSDDALFNLCEDVRYGKKIDTNIFYHNKSLLNVCYTNLTRKAVNNEMLKEYYKQNPNGRKLRIEKLKYDDNSQEYTLLKGMPLIARKNNKALNIFNNEMFKCKSIKKDTIIVENELGEEIEVEHNNIKHLFHIAFCVSVHRSQGATFHNNYTIYEWDRMDRKLRYVALSRGTEIKNINII